MTVGWKKRHVSVVHKCLVIFLSTDYCFKNKTLVTEIANTLLQICYLQPFNGHWVIIRCIKSYFCLSISLLFWADTKNCSVAVLMMLPAGFLFYQLKKGQYNKLPLTIARSILFWVFLLWTNNTEIIFFICETYFVHICISFNQISNFYGCHW